MAGNLDGQGQGKAHSNSSWIGLADHSESGLRLIIIVVLATSNSKGDTQDSRSRTPGDVGVGRSVLNLNICSTESYSRPFGSRDRWTGGLHWVLMTLCLGLFFC